ncbi:MAG: ORF6N domain-containing protein [Bacteroidota bacterium]
MDLQVIQNKIYELRGQRVMLDFDLAEMYEVETRTLKQAVKRNLKRFPNDFMFQLTKEEFKSLTSQIVISKRGGTRYMPFAFTEQGVSMLSAILNSEKAILVSIEIIRAFVMFRQHLADYKSLKKQIAKIENDMSIQFKDIHQALNYLLQKEKQDSNQKNRKKIGFK